jgi:ESCRT-I complex subunit TSG101
MHAYMYVCTRTCIQRLWSSDPWPQLRCTLPLTLDFYSTGVTYNIPLTIWLRPNHPYVPPMVYVTPTRDMGIQPSQFVDANGVVYLPYLNEWKVVSNLL